MAIRAELPDGQVLEFPDGTDQSVIQSTVKRVLSSASPFASVNEDIGALEAGLIGAGRGLTKIGRAVGLADQEDEAVTAAFRDLQERRPVSTTVGEIAGESAPFLVPGAGVGAALAKTGAKLGTKALATGALGALEGGLIARGEGGDTETQLASAGIGGLAAGAIELALPSLGRVARRLIRKARGTPPAGVLFDATGNPTTELQTALRDVGLDEGDVLREAQAEFGQQAADPDQVARKAFLGGQGLEPTRAQITRDAGDFQAQQEAAKTSGRVREALEGQEAILTTRFNNEIAGTGGQATSPTSAVNDVITKKAESLDKEIGGLYKSARESASGEKNISFGRLAKAIKDKAPSDTKAGGNIRALSGKMQEMGILDKNLKQVGRVDVEKAEGLRQFANTLFDPQNPFGNTILRELKDSLDDDVFSAAGKDIFKQARKAKADFEGGLSRAKVSKFDSRKKNIVRDIIENSDSVNPEEFTNKVVFGKSWRASDLKQAKDYLLDGTGEAGRAAFNDLRAEALQGIKEKAFIGPLDGSGTQALSADKLSKAVKSIGSEKLKILFEPKELKFLRDMMQVSKLREPVRGTQQGRGPSAQAIGALEAKLKDLPMLGALVDFIDIDTAGRAVLRANPKRVAAEAAPNIPAGLSAAISAPAVAGTLEEEK